MLKIILNIIFSFLIINILHSQGTLKINGANFVASGNVHVVLDNTNWQNNGTFTPSTSTVHLKGDATESMSNIGGSSPTTFYALTVNKSANNAQLGQNITVNNALNLTQGCLDIGNNNLTALGAVNHANTCFVKTSGTGFLKRNVGTAAVVFPVGNNTSFMPLTLENTGTADNFTVRVSNQVLANGNSGTAVSSSVVNATWNVAEEVAGGSNITMTATWNAGDETPTFDRSRCYIQHHNNSFWDTYPVAAATNLPPSGGLRGDFFYSISRANLSSFSPFSVASSTVLPVTLLLFYGNASIRKNQLYWTTANELHNKGFFVERRDERGAWKSIGFVAAKGGNSTYDFIDEAPLSVSYYRLRQIDVDGKETLSKVISLYQPETNQLTIMPNPTADFVTIGFPTKPQAATFQIFTLSGVLVLEGKTNEMTDISTLSIGTYIVKVGTTQQKLVKY
ncbi:MAG: hypothetical protein RL757_840 [Bacteroidota bacterium]|jgi:hypothetical protein